MAARKFRTVTRKIFLFITIFLSLVYLLAALSPFLNAIRWWFIAILGLAFPYLLFGLLILALAWVLVKPRIALVLLLVITLGWKSISVILAFNMSGRFDYQKKPDELRVVTWNVARFREIRENNNQGSQTRLKMMALLKEQNADVLCLQELHDATKPGFYHNINYIRNELGYPYHYYLYDQDGDRLFYGSAIFSRYPIIDTGFVRYPRPTLPDALLYADLKFHDDTVRIYTTHLQSIQLQQNELASIEHIESPDDQLLQHSKPILSKLKNGFINRTIQARIIESVLINSPYPSLLCADFNDVPNSYTYFSIRGSMQDAFLKKGIGFGRTYSSLSPTLRIDYILASQSLKVLQFNRIIKPYSDHYMLVSDVRLK